MTRTRRLAIEAFIAVSAAVLAWLVAPAQGVLLHWSPNHANPWRVPVAVYAVAVPIIVIVFGRLVGSIVDANDEHKQRPWRAECATGVACVVFAGIQHLGGDSVLLGFVAALFLGLASYSVTSRLS